MRKIILTFCLFVVGFVNIKAHPFYVSMCQVDYNMSNHSLEISLKIFADDLLVALENEGVTKLFLGEEREDPKADEYLFQYVGSELKFTVNGQEVGYDLVGKEMEDDVVWVYFEIMDIDNFNDIKINCTLLTETFPEQNNIIQVNKGGKIKNVLLNKNNTQGEVSF